MSANSIKSDDYTSSDFLKELLLTHSKNEHSQNAIPHYENNHQYKIKSSNSQMFSSHSSIISKNQFDQEDRKNYLKNFKQFFETLIDGIYDKQQLLHIWKLFEINIKNPKQCEKFINQFKEKQKQLIVFNQFESVKVNNQVKRQFQQIQDKDQRKQKGKVKNASATCPKAAVKNRNEKSMGKIERQQKREKNRMRRQISYVRKVIEHGVKFIQI